MTFPNTSFIDGQTPIVAEWLNAVNNVCLTTTNLINVLEFGAVGDGVTDDTVAIQNAHNAAILNNQSLYFPVGTYVCDTIYWGSGSGNSISWVGENKYTTVLKKKTSDSTSILVIGNSLQTTYINNVNISNLTFQGISGNTSSCITTIDLVRSTFFNCIFKNSIIGFESQGGISNTYTNCEFDSNSTGIKFTVVTGITPPAHTICGGGYPNNNSINNCLIIDNSNFGIWFDYGSVLNITECDIEGNGTSGNSSTMGVYIGPNIGSEAGVVVIGINLDKCWMEQNSGNTVIQTNSGFNNISNTQIVANHNATYDLRFIGGRYNITNCYLATNKTTNIKEESTITSGNYIINSRYNTISYDNLKTIIESSNDILLRGGKVPTTLNVSNPAIQIGFDDTSSNPTITFPVAFASPPKIFTQASNSSNIICAPQIYDVTASGFKIQKQQYTGTSISQANYYTHWIAIGEY